MQGNVLRVYTVCMLSIITCAMCAAYPCGVNERRFNTR